MKPPSKHLILLLLHRLAYATTDVLGGANFPDPSIIELDDVTYVFGTGLDGVHQVPWAQTSNFSDATVWSGIAEAMPNNASWAEPKSVWAPDVNQLTDGDGSFIMYYSPASAGDANNVHCISYARSENITGPYVDSSSEPWICPTEAGGAIDANGFLDDDGKRYVMYKIDGLAIHGGGYCSPSKTPVDNTSIMLMEVQNDGVTRVNGPASIWNNEGVQDWYQSEAPALVKGENKDTYFLLYSTGCYFNDTYNLKYVTSTQGIWGPYSDSQVLLETGNLGEYGPGSADVGRKGGLLVYHSLLNNNISDGRSMNTEMIGEMDGKLRLDAQESAAVGFEIRLMHLLVTAGAVFWFILS